MPSKVAQTSVVLVEQLAAVPLDELELLELELLEPVELELDELLEELEELPAGGSKSLPPLLQAAAAAARQPSVVKRIHRLESSREIIICPLGHEVVGAFPRNAEENKLHGDLTQKLSTLG